MSAFGSNPDRDAREAERRLNAEAARGAAEGPALDARLRAGIDGVRARMQEPGGAEAMMRNLVFMTLEQHFGPDPGIRAKLAAWTDDEVRDRAQDAIEAVSLDDLAELGLEP